MLGMWMQDDAAMLLHDRKVEESGADRIAATRGQRREVKDVEIERVLQIAGQLGILSGHD
jgi:hypothetical protein